jgi:hypothetical protein
VRGLHGPHAPLEPVNQFEVVGRAAEERLAEMDVRLDEAGQHGAAASVERHVRREARLAHGRDAPVAHQHVALEDPVLGVDGDDDSAFDED